MCSVVIAKKMRKKADSKHTEWISDEELRKGVCKSAAKWDQDAILVHEHMYNVNKRLWNAQILYNWET